MLRAATVHTVTAIGIDMGKNTLHMVGLDTRGTIVLREKVSRGRITSRLANLPPCLIGIEAGMATHYVARELAVLGHDVISRRKSQSSFHPHLVYWGTAYSSAHKPLHLVYWGTALLKCT